MLLGEGRLTGTARTGPQNLATPGQIENARGIARENESAALLAALGYVVVQNPPPKPNGTKPDYLIEGQYFDNYAPITANPIRIADGMMEKVIEDQASRIVLNLNDSAVTLEALREQLTRYPIPELEEIIVVKDGQVVSFFPPVP